MKHCLSIKKWLLAFAMVIAAGTCLPIDDDVQGLDELVIAENIMVHLQELDRIAGENNGIRAAGTAGFDASLEYVKGLLNSKYIIQEQEFTFRYFSEPEDARMSIILPQEKDYVFKKDFSTFKYSGSGQVINAEVVGVDVVMPPAQEANGSDSGCQENDFYEGAESLVDGHIALIQRGTCSYSLKAANAEAAGAVAIIIYNEGQEGRRNLESVTLGTDSDVTVPVVFTSYSVGEEIYNWIQAGEVCLSIHVSVINEERTTKNLLAETPSGREGNIVMAGAHLDSVESPGINDNGSGAAAILEIALQMYASGIPPQNRVRFAFWGAEELGLLGSTYYAEQISIEEKRNIEMYLNFDMLGSANYVRFVYDSKGAASGSLSTMSNKIEKIFYDYFEQKGLTAETIGLNGRSDHAPFVAMGIPVGGLFSGDEGLKTAEQAESCGGTPDEPYDPCYHKPCDDITNISEQALEELSKAAAYAIDYFANNTSAFEKGIPDERELPMPASRPLPESDYIGPLLYR